MYQLVDDKLPPLYSGPDSQGILLTEYVEEYQGNWVYSYSQLKPTGKWRLCVCGNGWNIQIQHRGLIFKYWIDETEIVYMSRQQKHYTCTA